MTKININKLDMWKEFAKGSSDQNTDVPSKEFEFLYEKFLSSLATQNEVILKAEKSLDNWMVINHALLTKNQALCLDITRLLKLFGELKKLKSPGEIKAKILQTSRLFRSEVSKKSDQLSDAEASNSASLLSSRKISI